VFNQSRVTLMAFRMKKESDKKHLSNL